MFFLYFSSSECVSVSMRLCVMQHLNIVFLVSWLEIYMNWTIFLVPFGLATWPFCFYTKFWKKDKKIATDCMCKRWCKGNEWMCLLMSVRNEKWHRMKWTRTFSYIKSKRQYRITISFCHLYNNAHFWNFIFTLFPHNVSLLFRVRSLTHSFQFLCVFFSLLL